MSFLNPFFLYLLPLSLVPLILFLGLKGDKKEVLFSTLFLLRSTEFKEEKIKQKLRLWLLIIIRILMIITIILLLSGPRFLINRWNKVYFDGSFSMRYNEKKHYSDLKKLFSLFGDKKIVLINMYKGKPFLLDTTFVPPATYSDIFYTDGMVSFLPYSKIICSNPKVEDSWVYVKAKSTTGIIIYARAEVPAWVYVYDSRGLVDSLKVETGTNRIIFNNNKKSDWYVFRLKIKDDFLYNNVFYYIPSKMSIPVRLFVKKIPLLAFFNTPPFSLSHTSPYCVVKNELPGECEKAVVFADNKRWENYVRNSDSLFYIGKVQAALLNSGIKKYLLLRISVEDTTSCFYDPYFIKAFSDYLKDFFKTTSQRRNLYIREFKMQNCRKIRGLYPHQGIFNCEDTKVAVNPDPTEYITPSICSNKRSIHLGAIENKILFPQRLLTYFLVLLFILETLLIYVIK